MSSPGRETSSSAAPRMSWERMTPLLPRAPSSAARATDSTISSRPISSSGPVDRRPAGRPPPGTRCSVSAMLSPVSPSATGKTLRSLISSRRDSRCASAPSTRRGSGRGSGRTRRAAAPELDRLGDLAGLEAARADVHAPWAPCPRGSAPSGGSDRSGASWRPSSGCGCCRMPGPAAAVTDLRHAAAQCSGPIARVACQGMPVIRASHRAARRATASCATSPTGAWPRVWAAEDELLGRLVAVKVLAPGYAQDERANRRFLREARARRAPRRTAATSSPSTTSASTTAARSWSWSTSRAARWPIACAAAATIPRALALRWLREAADALDCAHAPRRRPPRRQARQPAPRRARAPGRRRLRDRHGGGRGVADADRPGPGHRRLHLARAGPRPRRPPTPATATRWPSWPSSCSPAAGPSPPTTRRPRPAPTSRTACRRPAPPATACRRGRPRAARRAWPRTPRSARRRPRTSWTRSRTPRRRDRAAAGAAPTAVTAPVTPARRARPPRLGPRRRPRRHAPLARPGRPGRPRASWPARPSRSPPGPAARAAAAPPPRQARDARSRTAAGRRPSRSPRRPQTPRPRPRRQPRPTQARPQTQQTTTQAPAAGGAGQVRRPGRAQRPGLRAHRPGQARPTPSRRCSARSTAFRAQGRKGDIGYAYALYNLGNALRLSGHPAEAIPYLQERLQVSQLQARDRQEGAQDGRSSRPGSEPPGRCARTLPRSGEASVHPRRPHGRVVVARDTSGRLSCS